MPVPPTYPGKKFANLRAALEDGPKFFEELMAGLGSDDGREIVRELHTLRPRVSTATNRAATSSRSSALQQTGRP